MHPCEFHPVKTMVEVLTIALRDDVLKIGAGRAARARRHIQTRSARHSSARPHGALMSERSGDNPLVIRKLVFSGMAAADGWRPESTLLETVPPAGRTVGKSSLLNRLCGQKETGSRQQTPGRTREINFFRVNDHFVLADLPGYGYARVSKTRQAEWRPLLEGYIAKTAARGCSTASGHAARAERTMTPRCSTFSRSWECRRSSFLPNRINSRTAAAERAESISRSLLLDPEQTISFSAVTGEGRDELAGAIMSAVTGRP